MDMNIGFHFTFTHLPHHNPSCFKNIKIKGRTLLKYKELFSLIDSGVKSDYGQFS